MKRFTTVSLLLAGFIASCTARNIEVDNNFDRGSSSSEESSESMEFIRQIGTACYEKTGSRETFEAVIDFALEVHVCFYRKLNMFDLIEGLDHLNASTRHVFYLKYCPRMRNALSCFEPPMKQLRKCFDDIIQLRQLNATSEVVDLVCENDGEILFHEGYKMCMPYIFGYIEECTGFVSKSTQLMAVSKYGETQCREFAKVRDCMSKKFNECDGSSLIDVVDVYFRAVFKDSPCRNLAAIGGGSTPTSLMFGSP